MTDEELKLIRDFAINNPDELKDLLVYAHALQYEQWGWLTLPSGKVVYVRPPQVSGAEVGAALKKISERIKEYKSDIESPIVSFVDDSGNFKSTEQILQEVRNVWAKEVGE